MDFLLFVLGVLGGFLLGGLLVGIKARDMLEKERAKYKRLYNEYSYLIKKT